MSPIDFFGVPTESAANPNFRKALSSRLMTTTGCPTGARLALHEL